MTRSTTESRGGRLPVKQFGKGQTSGRTTVNYSRATQEAGTEAEEEGTAEQTQRVSTAAAAVGRNRSRMSVNMQWPVG